MLQLIEPTFNRPDIIARCQETGAYLAKSRAQYSLVVEQGGYISRHWSCHKVLSDQDALARAQKSLDKIMQRLGEQAEDQEIEAEIEAGM